MAFNGRFVLNIAHLASRNGGNINDLIELSNKTIEALNEENCIVDDNDYNAVIEEAVNTTKDNCFGLHAGENLNLSAAGLIVQLTQNSRTVKEALELCCQFANLGCSALPLHVEEKKEHYKISLVPNELWRNNSEVSFQHTAAGVIAFTIKEFHSLTRMKHNPIKVKLNWSENDNRLEFERVYGCSVEFNSKDLCILLKKQHVEDKVITSNYDLLKVLISHAEELTVVLQQKQGFSSIVKQSIINLIKPEFPTIDDVASHFNISSRTLQRKLKEENHTFKELIDELKKDFALGYMNRPDLNISDIAYLLNYADNSAFTRSFKRWTGLTPIEYRTTLD